MPTLTITCLPEASEEESGGGRPAQPLPNTKTFAFQMQIRRCGCWGPWGGWVLCPALPCNLPFPNPNAALAQASSPCIWLWPPASPALLLKDLTLLVSPLPRGRFSVVRQCWEKASGRALAAKIIPYQPEDKMAVLQEYEALKRLHHPHLAQLHAAYLSPRHLVLILELCSGPELLPGLAER